MKHPFLLRSIAAFCIGSVGAFAFAPFEYGWLAWIGLGALYALLQREKPLRAGYLGFLFGWGLFLFGVSWIWNSLSENGLSVAVSSTATVLLCAYLALFPALTSGLFRLWDAKWLKPAYFAALWTLTEWLRGHLFTGFSWLGIGYLHAGVSWMDGLAPIIGVYGLSFLTVFSAALLVEAAQFIRQGRRVAAAIAVVLSTVWFPLGWLGSQIAWTRPFGAPINVSLIQGNLTMLEKWGPATLKHSQYLYLELTKKSRGQLVIWPETGIPRYLDVVEPEYLKLMLSHVYAHDLTLITGVSMRELTVNGETYRSFNSLAAFGNRGMQYYHKRHLVPFGEYIPAPFRRIVDAFLPMSDLTSGRELPDNPWTFSAQGVELAPTICYEDAFGEEILENARRSNILINVSNLAWFGKEFAPEQHFQISTMRAVETGRPMLSSTNTGVTGAVDAAGRVIARLPNNTRGVLEVRVQGRQGLTPYMRYGNGPILIFSGLLVCLAFIVRKR